MPKIVRKERSELEGDIQSAVRDFLAREPDVTIFRNAQVYVTFESGHRARTGLGAGSADLVGSLTVQIERSGVASLEVIRFARALGVEIKKPGEYLDHKQKIWHAAMARAGWIVGVVRSVDDARELLRKARLWEI